MDARVAALLAGLFCCASSVQAQIGLLAVDADTRVKSVSFAFADDDPQSVRFTADDLRGRIATRAPGPLRRLLLGMGIGDARRYEFDPVELQRDVVRLRNLYSGEGFLRASVDYAESTHDPVANTIAVRFRIRQGPAIIIQDVGFRADRGYLASALDPATRERWIRFRDRTSFRTGDRFTAFDVVRIEDQVLGWLKNEGYAFASLATGVEIDSVLAAADISFAVDPGPRAIVDTLLIEGNRRVGDRIVRRELPLREGDVFSDEKLTRGQRELFGLNLFQVAQTDVPEQPRDSTVTVRIMLREARLRYLTAETGYAAQTGVALEGQWSHRNFLGGARTLTALGEIDSGLLASSRFDAESRRLFRASTALAQPYFLVSRLGAVLEPFVQYERDPLLRNTNLPFNINRREYGLNSTLIYELGPFRAISFRYVFSRATQFAARRVTAVRDAYNKSVYTLSGTLGRTDNALSPVRGVLLRPFVEHAGLLQPTLGLGASGLEYFKAGLDVSAYVPLTARVRLGVRLGAGRLWPLGRGRSSAAADGTILHDPLFAIPLEDRYDPVLFYAGGASDVRGWNAGLLGPKVNRTEFVRDDDGAVVFDDSGPRTTSEVFEPTGGKSRLLGSVEVRIPLPGLGRAYHAAVFLDAGRISARYDASAACTNSLPGRGDASAAAPVQCGFSDRGSLGLDRFKFGAGAGIRYQTPIGYARIDLGFKLNPDDLDLQSPRSAFLASRGLQAPERSAMRRLGIHISLGQAF